MRHWKRRPLVCLVAAVVGSSIWSRATCGAQTSAVIEGRVLDASESGVPEARVSIRNQQTEFETSVRAGPEGRYRVVAVPPGTYRVAAEAPGFRAEVIEALVIDAGRTVVRDFRLTIATRPEVVVVTAEVPLVDRATMRLGAIVTAETIRQVPLNGRHFIDLNQLVPGAMAPSQAGFSSRPIRGVGALAFNIAGNREEAVAFLVNGVATNNLTFGSLIFEPPLDSVQEFTVDSSVLPADTGHVSGARANVVTRSGTDAFHGSAMELFRNDALDARNFFEFTSPRPHPFTRHQFGGSGGGPVRRGRTYFFGVYEGFRQRQGVDLNSLVLSDAERAAVTHPAIGRLLPFIPRANYFDSAGTARFVGSAPAVVDIDRWSIDLRHTLGPGDRLHGFYGAEFIDANEPTSLGNSIPGFGHVYHPSAGTLTFEATHVSGQATVNELRFGRSHLNGGTIPAAPLNPADFGIGDGVTAPIGLPQMIVAGDLNFGGPGPLPQGRHDALWVVNDVLTRAAGRHSVRIGGEYRHFVNSNFAQGTGVFNFPSVLAFMAGVANAFSTTLGLRTSRIDARAVSAFVQDRVAAGDALTLDLGFRYEWHVTPTERDDKFVVFDPATASLERVGVVVPRIYRQNALNLEPRVGVVWAPSPRTVLRAAYGVAADQPATTAVRDTAGNPPFGVPLTASGGIPIEDALAAAQPARLAPSTIDPGFRNATMRSWNVNVQRQLAWDAAATVGYMGSQGRHLRISANINQPVDGVRPFPAVSAASPIQPGAPLGNVTQVQSRGFSNYRAAWVALAKRLSHGLQLDASYTFSESRDTNSLNSAGFAVQDSADIAAQYGPSDFDTRHRFVLSAIYALPFSSHPLARGWQVSAIVAAQSGNPVNLVTSTSSLNGTPNTVRPDVVGPIRILGRVDQWFDTSAFVAANHFGNLSRNAVVGPAFHDTDVSVARRFDAGSLGVELRVDVFDVFNHANFGAPGPIVGSPGFGRITSTRLPTGEAGSSRQIQLSVKVSM